MDPSVSFVVRELMNGPHGSDELVSLNVSVQAELFLDCDGGAGAREAYSVSTIDSRFQSTQVA
jgi:hypothetical protein